MNFFVITLILTIDGVIGNPQAGGAGGKGAVSAGASAGGSGMGDGSASAGENLDGSAQFGGCSGQGQISGGVSGSADGQVGASGDVNGSGSANAGVDGQGSVSTRGDASLDFADAGEMPAASIGFPNTIKAKKTGQGTPKNPNSYVKLPWGSQEPTIEYIKTVDMDSPILIDGTLYMDGKNIQTISRDNPVSSCGGNKPGGWEEVIEKIYKAGYTPNGGCPVEPGSYSSPPDISAFEENFEKKPTCGDYNFMAFADTSLKEYVMSMSWSFTISGPNCTSPDSDS